MQFRELINDLSLRLYSNFDPGLLRIMINKSGLNWERKLKEIFISRSFGEDDLEKLLEEDLKGLASRLLALKGDKGGPLKRFVSTITNIQLLNQLTLAQDQRIFLPVPIQLPDGFFTLGQLLISLPTQEEDSNTRKKSDKNDFRISFLLELSNLGPLRSDLIIRGKEISGKFLLAREETRVLIKNKIPSFINNLKEKGFTLIRCEYHLQKPETLEQSLMREVIQMEGHTINLVV